METKFGQCQDCLQERECPLYLCIDKEGFLVICCIVYMINNSLTIVRRMDDMFDDPD